MMVAPCIIQMNIDCYQIMLEHLLSDEDHAASRNYLLIGGQAICRNPWIVKGFLRRCEIAVRVLEFHDGIGLTMQPTIYPSIPDHSRSRHRAH